MKMITIDNNGPYEATLLQVSNKRVKETFNWNSKYNVEDMIIKTVEWTKCYIENPENISEKMNEQILEYLGVYYEEN